MDIEKILRKTLSKNWVNFIVSFLLFIGSFGIYLGRFLRWNSWDIIREPFGLLIDIGYIILNPIQLSKPWGLTIFMGIFLNMVYWSLKLIQKRKNQETILFLQTKRKVMIMTVKHDRAQANLHRRPT